MLALIKHDKVTFTDGLGVRSYTSLIYLAVMPDKLATKKAKPRLAKAMMLDYDKRRGDELTVLNLRLQNLYPATKPKKGWDPNKGCCPPEEEHPLVPRLGTAVAKAEQAVYLFTDAESDGMQDCYVSDMITSLLHFCHMAGFDTRTVVDRAYGHFREEAGLKSK